MALRVKITAYNRYLSHFSKFLCNSNECAANVKSNLSDIEIDKSVHYKLFYDFKLYLLFLK